ncbi:MAG: hypothetical protein FWC68_01145 [Oscillospiraceae bacterium]|nr:hypothetical protein [Oscillospiraceae bacterium]
MPRRISNVDSCKYIGKYFPSNIVVSRKPLSLPIKKKSKFPYKYDLAEASVPRASLDCDWPATEYLDSR